MDEGTTRLLQAVVDALSAHIAVLDSRGVIRAVNRAWRTFADANGLAWPDYGLGRDYLATLGAAAARGDPDAGVIARGIALVQAGAQDEFCYEYPCGTPAGPLWFIMWATPVVAEIGTGVVVAHEDITVRKLAEMAAEEARQVAERRSAIAAALKGILAVLNSGLALDRILLHILTEARALLAATTVALVPSPDSELSALCDPSCLAGDPEALALSQTEYGNPGPAGDESSFPSSSQRLVSPVQVAGAWCADLIVYYAAGRVLNDDEVDLVTDLALQTSLAIENEALRRRVQASAIESERARLLRELHDSVSQTLFSANLIADTLPRIWRQHPEEAIDGLEQIRELTRAALVDFRTLLQDLDRPVLVAEPLNVSIERLADQLSRQAGVPVRRFLGSLTLLPAPVQVNLYRIAEEALNNALRHADAHNISIDLSQHGGAVWLRIEDDGRGFDPTLVSSGHHGLGIMRHRAEEIAADLDVHSAPGAGTKVRVQWEEGKAGGHGR
ncbi:MAG: sensor histidine kinase [Chloroflexi bacterium]|nr:sensor histidine kinase [Chloroflexota bacterium]